MAIQIQNNVRYALIPSPLGELLLTANDAGITGLYFEDHRYPPNRTSDWVESSAFLQAATEQIEEYFQGQRQQFQLTLAPQGTPFQETVWLALRQIPFGETVSYQEVANSLKKPSGARAVGTAIGRNPLSIIVPCHRVVASTGALSGFAGGLPRKQFLLDLENPSRKRTTTRLLFG